MIRRSRFRRVAVIAGAVIGLSLGAVTAAVPAQAGTTASTRLTTQQEAGAIRLDTPLALSDNPAAGTTTSTMGVITVPASGVAPAARAAPGSATVPSAGLTELIGNLVDNGNGWYLDGRENCCGGVHMAAPGSDPATQEWDVYYNPDSNTYTIVDNGNGWALDGRDNYHGGVHMAPAGSDPVTQQWGLIPDGAFHAYLIDIGNGWALDGRDNYHGGVHMAPAGSDPVTQSWNIVN